MQDKIKRYLTSNNAILIYTIAIISIIIASRNSRFLSVSTIITLSRAMLVTLLFALGEMLVIITGGIDVAFPAIANFALYFVAKLSISYGIDNVALMFLIASVVGILFGSINALLVSKMKVPPLIATLGVSSIVHGATLAFLGTAEYSVLPSQITALGKVSIYTFTADTGATFNLSVLILIPVVALLVINYLLKYTVFGRSLYVIGGDKIAARTTGYNVRKIETFAYIFSGFLAGLGGVTYMTLMNTANPQTLMGSEMLVIAAVVMGGTRITGGHGTVFGTILGVALITLIQNNLVMLGIPSHYQTFVIGFIIILGTIVTAIRAKRMKGR